MTAFKPLSQGLLLGKCILQEYISDTVLFEARAAKMRKACPRNAHNKDFFSK
jgi:hypothetical protein